ncbi:MAG TPA: hypothetical protein VK191_00240, partial [Symbiobacteriaceae bacterium]|nr:hypothetical protein [Symbiobacteriaceae bacterium]
MSTNTVTYSSELMQNYSQAEVMAPDGSFQALQTTTGLSLLFSQSSAGVLYVVQEQAGSASGWVRSDLSSAQIAKDFPGQSGIVVKRFAVSQDLVDGSISLAMIVSDSQNDHVYLSLGNSASDTSWTAAPAWTAFPYDNPSVTLSAVKVVGTWISDATDAEYIMVDVARNPGAQPELVSRFYIDPTKQSGYAWCQRDLPIDLQADRYETCPGRQAGAYAVEGLYTAGEVDGSAQFIFTPLYNAFSPDTAPSPVRLNLPGAQIPDAIASCRNSDNSTDLYVAAGGALYYFASTNQKDQATGVQLIQSPLLNGVRNLYACTDGKQIAVWGLNGSDQVFYTTCTAGQQASGPWSLPLPIMTGVDLVSPYVNRANSANCFFASNGTDLFRLVQSPETTIWSQHQITLPPLNIQTPARQFASFTTRLQVADGSGQPVAGAPLQLSAVSRASFLINNLYYVLDTLPITVNTDNFGSITIIEIANGLNATRLQVADGSGTTIAINPMDKPMQKTFQLNTAANLQNAVITNPDGSTQKLVGAGVSSTSLQGAAQSITALQGVYGNLTSGNGAPPRAAALLMAAAPAPQSLGDSIEADFGDLVRWLESGVDYMVSVVKDAATDVWNFVVTIADQVYSAVLDCVEQIAAAAVWVFNAIKVAIEDLIKFLQFLFEWQDITRTKQVIKNLIQLWLQAQIGSLSQYQSDFDSLIANLESEINGWAGITDWSGLGTASSAGLTSSSTPTVGLSAPSTMLAHHFQNNASNLTQTSPPTPANPGADLITALLNALQSEGTVLSSAYTELANIASSASSLSLGQLLSKLVAVLADGVLSSAQVVVDTVFAILEAAAEAAYAVLDTPVWIPVVSDILAAFGVPSISMIDLFCWIAAVPYTIGYKMAHGVAPFPDDQNTTFLTGATSFASVQQACTGSQRVAAANDVAATAFVAAPTTTPSGLQSAVFVAGHALSGFFTFMSCFLDSFEAAEETGENDFAVPSAIVAILSGAADGAAVVLAPQDPITSTATNYINRITLAARIIAKLVFSGPVQNKLSAGSGVMSILKAEDGRATGAVVDAILTLPALGCTIEHFVELSKAESGKARSNAIIEETANVTSYCSRVSYAVAVNAE